MNGYPNDHSPEERTSCAYSFKRVFKTCVSKFTLTAFCLAVSGGIVMIISRISPEFAEFWNGTAGSYIRVILAYLTNVLPFSLAELLLLCVPIILALLISYGIKYASRTVNTAWRFGISCFAFLALILAVRDLSFTSGYYTRPIEDRMGIQKQTVTSQKLERTARILLREADRLTNEINYLPSGRSFSGMDTDDISKELNQAYKKVCDEYDFITDMYCRVKPIVLSEPMAYTHIAGVYTYYTGEANLNVSYPDYTLPYSAAHEMAHQRGIVMEEEANFVAFLACINSDDPYIRYSGYLEVYGYVASALFMTDAEAYYSVLTDMPEDIRRELKVAAEAFEPYEDNVAADISDKVNDTYLKVNGQEAGTLSYELVVELAVAYFAER